jgi:hypothetical protein
MTIDVDAVQESIKLTLDAAEAAADITAEYSKIRNENKKLMSNIESIYKNARTIAIVSLVAVIGSMAFAFTMHFNSVGSLRLIGDTSREALVVFAKNVDGVNKSLDDLKGTLSKQEELLGINRKLLKELEMLKVESAAPVVALGTKVELSFKEMEQAHKTLNASVIADINKMSEKLAALENASTDKILAKTTSVGSSAAKGSSVMSETNKALQDVITLQRKTSAQISELIKENGRLLGAIEDRSKQIKYP